MDLLAYAQIEDLEQILEANNIEVPRLRGLDLMVDKEPRVFSNEYMRCLEKECTEDLCRSTPFWNPNSCTHTYSCYTSKLVAFYTSKDDIRWDRIHGKKRKVLKTYTHNEKVKHQKQADVFNKYVGRSDVIRIHARIGGDNWAYFGGAELSRQPWFLEKVDDAFDNTYCDIYAKIEEVSKDADGGDGE